MTALRPLVIIIGMALVLYIAAPEKSVPVAEPEAAGVPVAAVAYEPQRDFFGLHPSDLWTLDKLVASVWSKVEDKNGVPGFAPLSIPRGIDELPVKKRKVLFIQSLIPHIVAANEKIFERRQGLLEILGHLEKGNVLGEVEKVFLEESARCYEMVSFSARWLKNDPKKVINGLLKRVDVVPPSLVVAQAASESGWGGSRFAIEGNNLFGQWSFSPTKGIIPAGLDAGANISLAKYPSIAKSLDSYLTNINTFTAYDDFREIRHKLRQKGEKLDPEVLAQGLLNYSTRREGYVSDILKIIRQNDLARYDDAYLVPLLPHSIPGSVAISEHSYQNL